MLLWFHLLCSEYALLRRAAVFIPLTDTSLFSLCLLHLTAHRGLIPKPYKAVYFHPSSVTHTKKKSNKVPLALQLLHAKWAAAWVGRWAISSQVSRLQQEWSGLCRIRVLCCAVNVRFLVTEGSFDVGIQTSNVCSLFISLNKWICAAVAVCKMGIVEPCSSPGLSVGFGCRHQMGYVSR